MHKSTLLEIIRTFSKQELIKFEEFVRSPFFNKKENITKLFVSIKKYSPAFTDENLDKEKVWDVLFPGAEYNYGIMKNLIFDLSKLAEQFIISLKSEKDEYKQNEYLINALLDRKLNKICINKLNAIDKKPDLDFINSNNFGIEDYFNFISKMYYIKLLYHDQIEPNFKIEDLQIRQHGSLITNFLAQLLMAYNDAMVISDNENTDLQKYAVTLLLEATSPVMKKIMESLKETSDLNFFFVSIYYAMYLCRSERTERRYLEFKNLLFKNLNLLPKSDLQNFYCSLINALSLIKIHNLNYHREMLEILDSQVANNAITDFRNDKIPLQVFNRYIHSCFILSDSGKLSLFTDRFINNLESDQFENTNNYAHFMICFINNDYQNALKYISLLDVPYANLKVTLRYEKAMCLYETDNYEMFLNEFDSMKHFINKNNFLNDRTRTVLNKYFLFIKKLFNLRQNFDKYEYVKLKDEISSAHRNIIPWFQEKLDEIENANKK